MPKDNLINYIQATADNKRFKDFSNLLEIHSHIEALESDLDNCKWLLDQSWKTNRRLELKNWVIQKELNKLKNELAEKQKIIDSQSIDLEQLKQEAVKKF